MSKVTIIDVAKHAGVSKSTVSRVIRGEYNSVNPATRDRVMQSINELGYEKNAIAGSLRTNETKMIMLIIPDIVNSFWPEVARGVQDALEINGYTMVLSCSDWERNKEQRLLLQARNGLFDGIIINPASISEKELQDCSIPSVILGYHEFFPEFDMVGNDTSKGTQLILNHLYELGHRKIGFICGVSMRSTSNRRISSYMEFMKEKGIEIERDYILQCHYGQENGYEAMKQLMNLSNPPTAVYAGNDILAIGALKAAREMKIKIPGECSLAGMDDIYPATVTSPTLTTVAKEKYKVGWQAAVFLLDRIRSKEHYIPRKILFPPVLVKRESTGPV
ncbi:MAG TPA: LacI family DNA-binding transcriptional regulator [Thermotogota bacterium]|nr:LacI family DNA-binding transcriptional regulator [Thermotogota bacterium]HPJ90266.1 LacI family DNA-binding transcriptional regulator [Thermotogota bacterium]HPR97064.1 LacI family DNA-binding transcriptional regulator [Thermotogota bacterium]